jgi:hypothetical protein
MVTVATRVRTIADREKFDIVVTKAGKPVKVTKNGVLGKYPYDKRLKDSKTVSDWKKERFETSYPGYTCDVLMGDGTTATGQKKLKSVRASYEE